MAVLNLTVYRTSLIHSLWSRTDNNPYTRYLFDPPRFQEKSRAWFHTSRRLLCFLWCWVRIVVYNQTPHKFTENLASFSLFRNILLLIKSMKEDQHGQTIQTTTFKGNMKWAFPINYIVNECIVCFTFYFANDFERLHFAVTTFRVVYGDWKNAWYCEIVTQC